MSVSEINYFESRPEPKLWKMLILIGETNTSDLVIKLKKSDVFGLLTYKVTNISSICQLEFFIKYFDQDKNCFLPYREVQESELRNSKFKSIRFRH